MQEEYIDIGKLNKKIFYKINQKLITNEVIFTYERINHVENKRIELYNEVKEAIPKALYSPDYIYKDWNNRENTLVLIKSINKRSKLNIVLKIAISSDDKHSKNSIITMIKIGEKTFNKIVKNKNDNLLYKNTGQK